MTELKPFSTLFIRPDPEHVAIVGYEKARDIQAEASRYMQTESARMKAELDSDKRATRRERCDRCHGPIEGDDRIVTVMEGRSTWHRSCLFASPQSARDARRANRERQQITTQVDPRQAELFL